MKLFIIRLLLITVLFLLIRFVLHKDDVSAIIWAFAATYVIEPLITSKT
jgi:hypothetical protein